MKKIMNLVLPLIMIVTLLHINTFNVSSKSICNPEDYIYEKLADGTIKIIRYEGNNTDIIIPSMIDGKVVTRIGKYAFFETDSLLTNINIPSSVENIEYGAFFCNNLANITVDSDNQYFSSCNGALLSKDKVKLYQVPSTATKFTIPNSVTSIEDGAFYGCTRLTSIIIPNNVKSIGDEAFCYCYSLANISISNNVKSIGGWAFEDCSSLTDITIPNSVISLGEAAFMDCSNLCSITISNGITSIGANTFRDCNNLRNIIIPNNVTNIGDWAFSGCNSLKNITIPNSVTSIGDAVFCNCNSLTNIIIPNSVKNIGEWAFDMCPKLTLSVYADSYGLEYSKKNNIPYKIIEDSIQTIGVKLNKSSLTLKKKKTYTLKTTFNPSNATNKKLTWTSSNSKVVKVNSKGVVTAVNYGKATITAKTNNGKTAKCTVTVPYTITYKLNGGKNNKSNPSSYYGKKITLKNPTKKGYTFNGWYSDSKFKKKVTSFSSGNKTLYAKWTKVKVSKAKTPKLTNVKGKKLKITYSATSGAKGYQIQYSTSKKFTKATTKTVKGKSATYTLAKKTYYVRVRAYKTDSSGAKVYGSWSTVKSIKIKK